MTPSKGFLVGIAAVVIVGVLATTMLYRIYLDIPDPQWSTINEKIRRDFPGIPQISTETLAIAIERRSPTLTIDCRTPEEFAVSHIPGAVHATTVDEVKAFAAPDAEIVVYCSVGYRSGKLVSRLGEAGFHGAKNLEGSIFTWANEDRPLVDGSGAATSTVHPHSKHWGKLLGAGKRHPVD